MRRPTVIEVANALLWLAVLAVAVILFWGSDKLWMMIMAVLVNGWVSMGLLARGCQEGTDAL